MQTIRQVVILTKNRSLMSESAFCSSAILRESMAEISAMFISVLDWRLLVYVNIRSIGRTRCDIES